MHYARRIAPLCIVPHVNAPYGFVTNDGGMTGGDSGEFQQHSYLIASLSFLLQCEKGSFVPSRSGVEATGADVPGVPSQTGADVPGFPSQTGADVPGFPSRRSRFSIVNGSRSEPAERTARGGSRAIGPRTFRQMMAPRCKGSNYPKRRRQEAGRAWTVGEDRPRRSSQEVPPPWTTGTFIFLSPRPCIVHVGNVGSVGSASCSSALLSRSRSRAAHCVCVL